MEPTGILNWSFRLFRAFGLEVRVHWSWFLLPLLGLWWAIHNGIHWWLWPLLVVVPFVSVLLHEFGHSFMTRLVGGESQLILMWALGGLAYCEVPATPGRRFAVSAAGPLVNFMIFAILALATPVLARDAGDLSPIWRECLAMAAYAADVNLYLLLFNLLPAHPLDGGGMLRAALWPLLGLRPAITATIVIAYVIIAGLAIVAVVSGNLILLAIGLWMLAIVIQEHVALHRGFDPYLGQPDDLDDQSQPLLASWLEHRRQRRREKEERTTAAEQQILDRLLAKVSQLGLPSLTDQERSTLQRISRNQRGRQTTGR